MTSPPATAGAAAATPFAIAAVLAVRGAVLAKLWAWFVVPLGVAHLSWPHAMGLSLVASVLLVSSSDDNARQMTAARVLTRSIGSVTVLMVCLAVAAVVAVAA